MRNLLVYFCLLILLTNCSKDQSPIILSEYRTIAITEDYSAISDPEERWRAYNIKDYIITQRVGCFCPFTHTLFRIVVKEGEIYRILNHETEEIITNPPFSASTIIQLFKFVNSIDPDSVARFEVEYDDKFGYPKSVYVDYDSRIADEEISYTTEFLNKITFR